MTPEDRLDQVTDKQSFIAFVKALAEERQKADVEEKANPRAYMFDGAYNWQNSDIASFLQAALCYFEDRPFHKPEEQPSWRMFAEFLYFGKIYE
jgi:hypothetical protein